MVLMRQYTKREVHDQIRFIISGVALKATM